MIHYDYKMIRPSVYPYVGVVLLSRTPCCDNDDVYSSKCIISLMFSVNMFLLAFFIGEVVTLYLSEWTNFKTIWSFSIR